MSNIKVCHSNSIINTIKIIFTYNLLNVQYCVWFPYLVFWTGLKQKLCALDVKLF